MYVFYMYIYNIYIYIYKIYIIYLYKYIYVIMKTMCLPDYHHNGFVATHAYYICQLMSAHVYV